MVVPCKAVCLFGVVGIKNKCFSNSFYFKKIIATKNNAFSLIIPINCVELIIIKNALFGALY